MKSKGSADSGNLHGGSAGIGPEVVVKAVLDDRVQEACCPLVVGDAQWLDRTLQGCRLPGEVRVVDGLMLPAWPEGIWVLDLGNVPEGFPWVRCKVRLVKRRWSMSPRPWSWPCRAKPMG